MWVWFVDFDVTNDFIMTQRRGDIPEYLPKGWVEGCQGRVPKGIPPDEDYETSSGADVRFEALVR